MFADTVNHDIIRKYIAYFAAIFSNIHVTRTQPDGTLIKKLPVPLHFAKMEHALQRVNEDPDLTRPDAIVLPAMSYDLLDLAYASGRHNATRNRFAVPLSDDANKLGVMHAAAPYDFHFQLSVLVKNITDAFDIIEEIAGYFTPDFTAKLELVPEMNVWHEIPVLLQQTALDFDVPKDYKERVTYIAVFDFVVQGVLYGPEKKWPLIKFSNVSLMVDGGAGYDSNRAAFSVSTKPGLDANGNPTTNAAASVDYMTIRITDNYDYVEVITPSSMLSRPTSN